MQQNVGQWQWSASSIFSGRRIVIQLWAGITAEGDLELHSWSVDFTVSASPFPSSFCSLSLWCWDQSSLGVCKTAGSILFFFLGWRPNLFITLGGYLSCSLIARSDIVLWRTTAGLVLCNSCFLWSVLKRSTVHITMKLHFGSLWHWGNREWEELVLFFFRLWEGNSPNQFNSVVTVTMRRARLVTISSASLTFRKSFLDGTDSSLSASTTTAMHLFFVFFKCSVIVKDQRTKKSNEDNWKLKRHILI